MPRKKKAPYLCVDLGLMQDPQVKKLARKLGRGAVLLWLEILMRFHDYEATDFMVPLEDLEDFKEGFFLATPDEVAQVIGMAAEFGWLKIHTDSEGREYMFNERRQLNLREQKLKYLAQKKGADETNEKRKVNQEEVR